MFFESETTVFASPAAFSISIMEGDFLFKDVGIIFSGYEVSYFVNAFYQNLLGTGMLLPLKKKEQSNTNNYLKIETSLLTPLLAGCFIPLKVTFTHIFQYPYPFELQVNFAFFYWGFICEEEEGFVFSICLKTGLGLWLISR